MKVNITISDDKEMKTTARFHKCAEKSWYFITFTRSVFYKMKKNIIKDYRELKGVGAAKQSFKR